MHLMACVKLLIHQVLQVLLCRATLMEFISQSVYTPSIAPTQIHHPTLGLVTWYHFPLTLISELSYLCYQRACLILLTEILCPKMAGKPWHTEHIPAKSHLLKQWRSFCFLPVHSEMGYVRRFQIRWLLKSQQKITLSFYASEIWSIH